MRKIEEHTYGLYIFMRLQLDNGDIETIEVYLRDDGEHYQTSADDNEIKRNEIINAFNELY